MKPGKADKFVCNKYTTVFTKRLGKHRKNSLKQSGLRWSELFPPLLPAFPQFVPGETPKTPQTPYSKEFC